MLTNCMQAYVRIVAKRSLLVCFTVTLISLLLCVPALFFVQLETNPLELLSSSDSRQKQNVKRLEAMLATPSRRSHADISAIYATSAFSVIISPTNETHNVITPQYMSTYVRFLEILHNVTAIDNNGKSVTFTNVCTRSGNRCSIPDALKFWNGDLKRFLADRYPMRTVSINFKSGDNSIFGDVQWDPDKMFILSIGALKLDIATKKHSSSVKWREAFAKTFSNKELLRTLLPNVQITFMIEEALTAEIIDTIIGFGPIAAVGVVVTYLIVLISFIRSGIGFYSHVRKWRVAIASIVLSTYGVFMVITSIVCSISLLSLFGVPVTPLTIQGLPLLMLGVGVDTLFVYFAHFHASRQEYDDSDYEFVRLTLTSVYTPLTICMCIVGLAYGQSPLLSWTLCYQAIASILLNYIFSTIAFSSALFIYNRILGHDVNKPLVETEYETSRQLPMIKVVILLAFIASLIASIIIIRELLIDRFDINETYPDGSIAFSFQKQVTKFGGLKIPTVVAIDNRDNRINFADPIVQKHMRNISGDLPVAPFVSTTAQKIPLWDDAFLSWIVFLSSHSQEYYDNQRSIPQSKYYIWLNEFLNDMGSPLKNVLVKLDTRGNQTFVSASIAIVFRDSIFDLAASVIPIAQQDGFVESHSNATLGISSNNFFAFCLFDIISSPFINSVERNTICIAISISLISLMSIVCLWPNIILTVYVIAMIVLFIVHLVAIITLMGITYNPVTVIMILLGTGMASEYFTHIVKAYILCEGNIRDTMKIMRSPLTSSIISTVVGLIPLAFIKIGIVRVYFFQMLLIVQLLILAYSFVIIPATIPSYNINDDNEKLKIQEA